MRVTAIGEDSALCADADGGVHQVAVDLIDGAAVGMTVLVHAGVAIGAAR
jgi:hydrogenase maturation factor